MPAQSIKAYTSHDWPVKKAVVHLLIKLKRNSKLRSVDSLGSLGAKNKDLGTASQTLLTGDKLSLRHRLNESPQTKTSSLEKHQTFIQRRHVLLRLMFLLVLIFFPSFAVNCFFSFFSEFNFLHFYFTLGCFIPVCNVCLL